MFIHPDDWEDHRKSVLLRKYPEGYKVIYDGSMPDPIDFSKIWQLVKNFFRRRK